MLSMHKREHKPGAAVGALLIIGCCGIGWPSLSAAQNRVNNALVYELIDRLNALERELRLLRNDFEEFQYRERTSSPAADSRGYDGLERRLSALERALGTASTPRPDRNLDPDRAQSRYLEEPSPQGERQQVTGDSAEFDPPPIELIGPSGVVDNAGTGRADAEPAAAGGAAVDAAEQGAYNAALNNLREGHYRDASEDFQAFLDGYPYSPLAADAYYWLGEAYYVNRDFDQAKQAYLTLGARYPNSDKLPDALLKLGYSYGELGERERARQVLEKLIDAFPGSGAARRGEQYLARLR